VIFPQNAINQSTEKINPAAIKIEEDEQGSDHIPEFGIQTVCYTATVTGCTKMISPVFMITCVQRNLTRLRRLFPRIKGNYYLNASRPSELLLHLYGHSLCDCRQTEGANLLTRPAFPPHYFATHSSLVQQNLVCGTYLFRAMLAHVGQTDAIASSYHCNFFHSFE
jgi:hypothetical protein